MRRGLLLALLAGMCVPAAAGGDADTISRHRGKRGGVVVLWPRVVPEQAASPEIQALAEELHTTLQAMAEEAVDPNRVMARPEPERVCPLQGCRAVSLGAVLGHHEGGCFAVGLVGLPDGGTVRLVPWGGRVAAKAREVPFREAPENRLAVKEFVPCGELMDSLRSDALKKVLGEAVASDSGSP